jgi:hypothetical protein
LEELERKARHSTIQDDDANFGTPRRRSGAQDQAYPASCWSWAQDILSPVRLLQRLLAERHPVEARVCAHGTEEGLEL